MLAFGSFYKLPSIYIFFLQEDFEEFSEVDELYSTLPLDKVESLEDLVTIGPPGLVKVKSLSIWFIFVILVLCQRLRSNYFCWNLKNCIPPPHIYVIKFDRHVSFGQWLNFLVQVACVGILFFSFTILKQVYIDWRSIFKQWTIKILSSVHCRRVLNSAIKI